MINQDAIPRIFWRIIGLAIASMGSTTLWVVGASAWGVFDNLASSGPNNIDMFAVFFCLLSGSGMVAFLAGIKLMFIDRPISKMHLVPSWVLMLAGFLLVAAMIGLFIFARLHDVVFEAISNSGFAMIFGLGISFMVSGIKLRKRRERKLFS